MKPFKSSTRRCVVPPVSAAPTDSDLVNFAAMISQPASHGIKVERLNLGQPPMALTQNLAVKTLLKDGPEVLPLIFLAGEIRPKGRYLTAERHEFFRAALGQLEQVAL